MLVKFTHKDIKVQENNKGQNEDSGHFVVQN